MFAIIKLLFFFVKIFVHRWLICTSVICGFFPVSRAQVSYQWPHQKLPYMPSKLCEQFLWLAPPFQHIYVLLYPFILLSVCLLCFPFYTSFIYAAIFRISAPSRSENNQHYPVKCPFKDCKMDVNTTLRKILNGGTSNGNPPVYCLSSCQRLLYWYVCQKCIKGFSYARLSIQCCSSGVGRGPPVSPAVSNRQSPFPRNVPSRSTFHSGQNRQRNHTPSYGQTTPMQSQDTSAISHSGRTSSFFSKLSSRFSKR